MKTAFINADIIDVIGKKTDKSMTIIVEDGRIREISGNADTSGCKIVDLSGKTVAPGLFNMHVHTYSDASPDPLLQKDNVVAMTLMALKNLETFARTGVTLIRDVETPHGIMLELREAIKDGRIKNAPDVLAVDRGICMTGGTTWNFCGYEADGEDECRKAARLMLRNKADWIKIFATGGVVTRGSKPGAPQLSEAEMRAIVEEGHKAGVKSCVHAQNIEGTRNAILAGADCIEHGSVLDNETIKLMLEHGTWLDATLAAIESIVKADGKGAPKEFVDKARAQSEIGIESFKKAHAAGVPCVCGTDVGTPFCFAKDTALELVLMVERAGIDPYEAFAIATINPARLCELDNERGSVEPGKRADLAVFGNDPIADINAAYNCVMTVKNGEILWDKEGLSA